MNASNETTSEDLFAAINAGCGALVHMAFTMQSSQRTFRLLGTNDLTSEKLAAEIQERLVLLAGDIRKLLNGTGDWLNGRDAVEDIDRAAASSAFAVMTIVLDGNEDDEDDH